MMDFPSPASEGQFFAPPGGPQYVYTNGAWRMTGAADVSITNIVMTTHTTSTTYVKPAGLKFLHVVLTGAGGGSIALGNPGAGGCNAGSGGGGGGTAISFFKASDLAASSALTIGVGSTGAAGGNCSFPGMVANGGGQGAGTGSSTTFLGIAGGTGGTAGGGANVLAVRGGVGEWGGRSVHNQATTGYGGGGGASYQVPVAPGVYATTLTHGLVGQFPGGGSRGGVSQNSGGAVIGNSGGDGAAILTEYF